MLNASSVGMTAQRVGRSIGSMQEQFDPEQLLEG